MWVAWKFPEMANAIRKFLERYSPRNQKLSKDETPEKRGTPAEPSSAFDESKRNLKDRTFVRGYFVLIKRFALCVIITTCRLFGLGGVNPQDFVGRLIVQILVWLVQCEV